MIAVIIVYHKSFVLTAGVWTGSDKSHFEGCLKYFWRAWMLIWPGGVRSKTKVNGQLLTTN